MSAFLLNYFNNRLKNLNISDEDKNNKRVFDTFNNALQEFYRTNLKNKKIIDLGCGDRSFINFCNKNNCYCDGFDISDNINFEKDSLPLIDNSVDVIILRSLIEHLNNPSLIITETMRCLKKDGIIIIVTPNFYFNFKNFYHDPTHVKPYTHKSLLKLLEIYNFNNIKVLPWLVCKPLWMWKLKYNFIFANYLIPFRGDFKLAPSFLKGKTKSILALAKK